jgi:glycoside/pentoside/hexuronide:cation symporter, GPH family
MSKDGSAANKPGLFERLSYGAGDFGFNLYWTTISAFLLIFYTDSFGLDPRVAGTMLLTTKLVDSVVDPLMGAISDRTKTKWGRYRPWLLWAAIPLAASAVLTFTTPDLDSTPKLIYAYATFAIMMAIYSVINIPYGALSGVLTNDPQARTQINSFRFVGGFLGGTFVTYCTPKLVDWFAANVGGGNEVVGWQLTMTLYGIIACALFFNMFAVTRERIEPIQEQKVSPWRDVADLSQNRPWMILFVLALVIMVTISTRMGAAPYYMKYYFERPDQTAMFLTVYGFALAAGALLTPVMARFLDKKTLLITLMTLVGILSIGFYFVPKGNLPLAFAMQIAIGLCLGPKSPLTFSMYADTADYTEYKTGRRATAMTFSAATFAQKLGGALASAVIGWVLASLGYVANQAQGGASQQGILLLMSVVPGALALLSAVIMVAYDLNDKRLADVQAELNSRKAKKDD